MPGLDANAIQELNKKIELDERARPQAALKFRLAQREWFRTADRLQSGRWSRDKADAHIKKLRLEPFESNSEWFDPLRDPFWPLATLIAQLVEMVFKKERSRGLKSKTGWDFGKRRPLSVHDVARDAAMVDPSDDELNVLGAIDAAWKEFLSGRLTVLGTPRDERESGHIPAQAWLKLCPWDYHGGPPDSIAQKHEKEASYYDVRVRRDEALKIWPALEVPLSVEEIDTLPEDVEKANDQSACKVSGGELLAFLRKIGDGHKIQRELKSEAEAYFCGRLISDRSWRSAFREAGI
jgi:hypothetical protein